MERKHTDASRKHKSEVARVRANIKRADSALRNSYPHLAANNGVEVYRSLKQVLVHMSSNTLTVADLSPLVAAMKYIAKTLDLDKYTPICNAVYRDD